MKLLLPLFVASAAASPGLFARDACNANNCLRAVRASSHSPGPSSATADCSRFQTTTLSPCVVTVTSTVLTTVAASPSTTTQTMSTATTTVILTTSLIELTTTATSTSVVVVTSTLVTTTTPVAAARKRQPLAAPIDVQDGRPLENLARAVASTCTPSVASSTYIPLYASACSGASAYASACSCAGITATTVTLQGAPSTTTSTVTSTKTTTSISTVTSTITSTVTSTSIKTISTTDITSIIPTTVTTTTVLVSTTTATAPVCSTYQFFVDNIGSRLFGRRVYGQIVQDSDNFNASPLFLSSSSSTGVSFTIRSDGGVYGGDVDAWFSFVEPAPYTVEQATNMNLASPELQGNSKVFCTVVLGGATTAGAIGTLSCIIGGQAISFVTDTNDTKLQQTTRPVDGGLGLITLAAVPACT